MALFVSLPPPSRQVTRRLYGQRNPTGPIFVKDCTDRAWMLIPPSNAGLTSPRMFRSHPTRSAFSPPSKACATLRLGWVGDIPVFPFAVNVRVVFGQKAKRKERFVSKNSLAN